MKDYGYDIPGIKVGREEVLNLIRETVNETGKCAFAISRSSLSNDFDTQLILYVSKEEVEEGAEDSGKYVLFSAYRQICFTEDTFYLDKVFEEAIKVYENDFKEAFDLIEAGTLNERPSWPHKPLEEREGLCLWDVFSEYELDTTDSNNVIDKATVINETVEKDDVNDEIDETAEEEYWYVIEVPTKEAQGRIFAVAMQ